MDRPRIFLSAVSEEFRSARRAVAATVRTLGFDPVFQDDSPTGHGELRQWLREQIDGCEGLLQIVGQGYGAEPPDIDPDYGRVSYTQFEFFYARLQGKKTWVIVAGEHCQRDKPVAELDLPNPSATAHQAERQTLQQRYLARLRAENHLRHKAETDVELENVVLKLRDELGELRKQWKDSLDKLNDRMARLEELLRQHLQQSRGKDASSPRMALGEWAAQYNITHEEARREVEAWVAQARSSSDHMARARAAFLAKNFVKDDNRVLLATMLAVLLVLGGLIGAFWWFGFRQQKGFRDIGSAIREKSAEDRKITQEKIRVQLVEASEKRLQAALLASGKVADVDERDRLRSAAEEAHQQRLSRIDDLAGSFAQIEGTAQASAIFNEMTRLLAEKGVEEALAYVASKRPSILEIVKARKRAEREQSRTELLPLLKSAVLHRDREEWAEGERLYADILALEPDWPEALHEKFVFLYYRSIHEERHGALAAALGYANDAEAVVQRLSQLEPDASRTKQDVSSALNKLGDLLAMRGRAGDFERALAHYERSLTLSEELLRANPGSAQAKRGVSLSLDRLGDLLARRGQAGDVERALAYYERSFALKEELLQANPGSGEAQRDVSVSLDRFGDLLAKRGQAGDIEKALAHYERCLKLSEERLTASPDSGQAKHDVSASLGRVGDLLARRGHAGDIEKALAHYERSLKLSEELLLANPGSGEAKRDVSFSSKRLGGLLAKRGQAGDVEQALTHYERSLKLSEELLRDNPDSARAKRDVSVDLNMLGDLLATRRDFAQVLADVANRLLMLGLKSDLDQALVHYERSRKLREELLTANPRSGQAQRDLSVSLEKLGDLLAERGQAGDVGQALVHYERSRKLREELLTANPGSGEAKRDVCVSYVRMAEIAEQAGRKEAKEWWRKAHDLLDSMKRDGSFLSPEDEELLKVLKEKVGR